MPEIDLLAQAYDPKEFRRQGHEIVDLLADHLESLYGASCSEKEEKVPEELYAKWEHELDDNTNGECANKPRGDLIAFLKAMMQDIIRLHHPQYMGHQTCVVAPPAALAEFVGCLLDPGMGVFEHGTTGVVLERLLSKKIGGLLGWKESDCEGFGNTGKSRPVGVPWEI